MHQNLCAYQSRVIRKIFNAKPESKRKARRRRQQLRWRDGVTQDISSLGITSCKNMAMNREDWQNLLKKSSVYKEMPMLLLLLLLMMMIHRNFFHDI